MKSQESQQLGVFPFIFLPSVLQNNDLLGYNTFLLAV